MAKIIKFKVGNQQREKSILAPYGDKNPNLKFLPLMPFGAINRNLALHGGKIKILTLPCPQFCGTPCIEKSNSFSQ